MKFFILLSVLFVTNAFAGDRVGNGGELVICPDGSGELVDLSEARQRHSVIEPLRLDGTEDETRRAVRIANERRLYLKLYAPEIYENFTSYLDEAISKMQTVDEELEKVHDRGHKYYSFPDCLLGDCATIPVFLCQNGNFSMVTTQFAVYDDNQNELWINKTHWESKKIAPISKAALLWHEAVYRWFRMTKGDQDSDPTRKVVGFLFANIAVNKMIAGIRKEINDKMPRTTAWRCVAKDPITDRIFTGYGKFYINAEKNAKKICFESTKRECLLECRGSNPEVQKTFSCKIWNDKGQDFTGEGLTYFEAQKEAIRYCRESGAFSNCSSSCDEGFSNPNLYRVSFP